MTHIIKRDGSLAPFDQVKILNAIIKANNATLDENMTPTDHLFLTEKVCQNINQDHVNHVEEIQDIVERTLIHYDYADTAKSYILYRAEHTKIRNSETYLMDIYKKLTYSSAKDADIKRENANIDGDTAMGTMLKYGSEGSKFFIDNYILPPNISKAHQNGDIHIHDKDFYMLTATCCQIDLITLFENGFSTGHGYLREPNSIESYSALACIAIQANQNEMHGGQSVPNFDYAMALGVKKTFKQEYWKILAMYLQIKTDMTEQDINLLLETLKSHFQEDIHINLISKFEAKLKQVNNLSVSTEALISAHHYACKKALANTDRRTYQAMEAFIHNLNTMNSRAGAQVPFSSINYGTDISEEGRMAIHNLLKATEAGLGNGETPIFPVQIFKVKSGVNFEKIDPNYDLFKQAMATSAKRLFPNFSFIDAPFNYQYYQPNSYQSEVAYMGCRTRVLGNAHDENRTEICGRGNLSFTSINLPRLGLDADHNINLFFTLLDEKIDLVIEQLLHRLKIQSQKKVKNYPFLMGQGIWIDSHLLNSEDTVEEVLKHGTLTAGFIGLAETLKALIGVHHGESKEAQELGLKIISHMRGRMDEQAKKTKLNFSLIATPAEGLSGRFVMMDREKYGSILGITDREYYTNSFHVPVYFPIKTHKKIDIEAPYHALTNGGHITYIELDGDVCKNLDAFETIIRHMQSKGIGYGAINHPLDRDPVCGYVGVIDNVCPRCGRKEGEAISVEKLSLLRQQYPNVPTYHHK
ncbi:anaerobic ribonucleoside triphosphate reductase [Commensalibacter papalotli (ex Servin-Garciduenas et al. 2014)]|uniref:Anaerobic ribonucleoside triphosphate reductase n=1 Tax=Commensalibacter papalotli (ex Servin-Garciduenas et al. 2014) TaxID=1208583 RepID=W7DUW9_9PROT|nr:anaerobic ribonucleoside triphosphate reductase [Commensalibacter papalotli (ex Servin-Garciduenas et al. 2014)]EUK18063.1 anaerobic ribonucleoside triphosphate reductase [Commensalibacter papalotli (ex Servin-Garciduenas et al. 2014)]